MEAAGRDRLVACAGWRRGRWVASSRGLLLFPGAQPIGQPSGLAGSGSSRSCPGNPTSSGGPTLQAKESLEQVHPIAGFTASRSGVCSLFQPLGLPNGRLGGGQRPQRPGGTFERAPPARATEAGRSPQRSLPWQPLAAMEADSPCPSGWPGSHHAWDGHKLVAAACCRPGGEKKKNPVAAGEIKCLTLESRPAARNLGSRSSCPSMDLAGLWAEKRPAGGRRQWPSSGAGLLGVDLGQPRWSTGRPPSPACDSAPHSDASQDHQPAAAAFLVSAGHGGQPTHALVT